MRDNGRKLQFMGRTRRSLGRLISAWLIITMILTGTGCASGTTNRTDTTDDSTVPGTSAAEDSTALGTSMAEDSTGTDALSSDTAESGMAYLPELSGSTLSHTPEFTRTSGCYDGEFVLKITENEGLTYYYTLDGSNPLDTGMAYMYDDSEGIAVCNRTGDANVVNAVPTALYDAANVKVGTDKKSFVTTSQNPSDDAIDKCTVVRVIGVDAQGNATKCVTATYFVGNIEDHVQGVTESSAAAASAGMGESLAIISITGNYDDFFDYDTGIYVKGRLYDEAIEELLAAGTRLETDTSRRIAANYNQKGRDWERQVHIDFFESDGTETTLVLSQDCGIRIQGNYSRSDLQKGFRLYARSEYGSKNFKYAVFGDAVTDDTGETLGKYKSLILRNGGNCAFTTKWSADYWAYMSKGLDVESQASRPAVVYLNGEYWGLYVLEENYSKDYFADKHGVDKDSVVLYKGDAEALKLGYKLDLGDLPEGVTAENFYFRGLLNFFAAHDSCESEEDYEELCRYVDPDSVRDYFAAEIWINNKWDWPGKNWSMWKVASIGEQHGIAAATVADDGGNEYADGRWRFCFYDMEFGGVSGSGDARTNTIKDDNYKTYGLLDMDTDNPAVLCFAYCMTNAGFREDFYARLRELGNSFYMKAKAEAVLNNFGDIYAPLYDQFFNAFPGTGSRKNSLKGGYASQKCIAEFLDGRYDYIETMIQWCEKHYADR